MALTRWRWIIWPAVAAAVLGILLLAGDQTLTEQGIFGLLSQTEWHGRGSFRSDVEAAVRVQERRLRDTKLADSLVAAALGPRALRSRDRAVTVVYEAPVTADTARRWLEAALAELTRYPGGASPGAPVVVALYSNPARARSPEYQSLWWGARRLLPDSVRTACVVQVSLVPVMRGPVVVRRLPMRPQAPFLGLCALYQRFGSPGSAAARWIGLGEWRLYGSTDAGWSSLLADARRPVPRREILRPGAEELSRGPWSWAVPWVQIGCLRGAWPLCSRTARISGGRDYWGYASLGRPELVASLLARGTPAQFAAFWRSPLGVSDALQQAYGRPAGQLAYEAFSHWYYAAPGGPRAGSRLVLAGLFWAGAALALAIVAGRRWKTEI